MAIFHVFFCVLAHSALADAATAAAVGPRHQRDHVRQNGAKSGAGRSNVLPTRATIGRVRISKPTTFVSGNTRARQRWRRRKTHTDDTRVESKSCSTQIGAISCQVPVVHEDVEHDDVGALWSKIEKNTDKIAI